MCAWFAIFFLNGFTLLRTGGKIGVSVCGGVEEEVVHFADSVRRK